MAFQKLLVIILVCLGTIFASPTIKENQNIIQIQNFQDKPIGPTGIVVVDDCGSNGRVSEVRVSDCDQTPCELHPGQNYEIEVDFSTSEYKIRIGVRMSAISPDSQEFSTSGDLWKVLVTAYAGNTSIIALDENVEAEIQPGEEHTLFYVLPVTDIFAGRAIRVQIQLIEVNTKVEEVCISANAFVIQPEPTTTEPNLSLN